MEQNCRLESSLEHRTNKSSAYPCDNLIVGTKLMDKNEYPKKIKHTSTVDGRKKRAKRAQFISLTIKKAKPSTKPKNGCVTQNEDETFKLKTTNSLKIKIKTLKPIS